MSTASGTGEADDFGAWVPGLRCDAAATGRGALDGVRLAVKDLVDVAGWTTTGGNPDWARTHGPAKADAPVVAALRAAGARVVGKTVTDELAFSLEGENAHHGTPRNPRGAHLLPGGSSSGSAVAVAAGLADLALGTDTGGSVRVPAAFCGVLGMRPTHGRVSLAGVIPFAASFDTVGWFARDPAVMAAAGHVLLGGGDDRDTRAAGDARPLRFVLARDAFALCDAGARAAWEPLLREFEVTREADVFAGGWGESLEAYAGLQALDIQDSLGDWIRTHRPRFGPAIAPRFEAALQVDPADGPRWRAWRTSFAAHVRASLAEDEAWLIPAAPCLGLARGLPGERIGEFYTRALAIGGVAGHSGAPQLVLPSGLSLLGARGSDERLLGWLLQNPGRATRSTAT